MVAKETICIVSVGKDLNYKKKIGKCVYNYLLFRKNHPFLISKGFAS